MTDPQNPNPNPNTGQQPPQGQPYQGQQYGQPYQGQQYGQPPQPGAPQYGAPQYGVPPQPYPGPPVKKKRKKWPWIVGALLVLLIIVFAATSGGGSEESSNAASTPTEDAPVQSASQTVTPPETDVPTETDAAPETQAPPEQSLTSEQRNAVSKAEDYLSISGFSKSGLIKQLEFEGYSNGDATVAVDKLEADGDVNWNEQAAKKAGEYQALTPFSRQGLIDQLKFDGFTTEQATHGADNAES